MATKKTIICLDMDGTIVNSSVAHARAYNLAFQKNHLALKRESEIMDTLGAVAEDVIKKLHPKISNRKLTKTIQDKMDIFTEDTFKLVEPIEGLKDTIAELKKSYRIALISNSRRKEISMILKKIKIPQKTFDLIMSVEDLPKPKPSAEIIFKVEKILRSRVEYFIGDTIYDIKTGKAAKIKTIGVLSGVGKINQLSKEDPTMIIENITILPEVLSGRL